MVIGSISPIPFSGRLIWDFFFCIAFSPEFSIFKHFYGINPPHDDLLCIPDETFTSGGLTVSQTITPTIFSITSNPIPGWDCCFQSPRNKN
jgi:hypothetical protein